MKPNAVKILLVEDDLNLGFVIKDSLEHKGYKVSLHTNGQSAMQAVLSDTFDICLLDIMLPKKDGFTLATEIRNEGNDIPIIFLTAKAMEEDRIKGFKVGADDYITKPFNMEEFVLRLEAVLKRCKIISKKQEEIEFQIGKFIFNHAKLTLTTATSTQSLTTKEAGILRLLCLNKNEVLKRETALKTIWGSDDYFLGRSMDVFIAKLRKYLKEDPSIKITNVHGVGFKFEVL
ncbi:MAG: response regulator transcription factor [Bacteroidetes bacterium]|nr:response regulator transcription factor [Bacteroidota bacterium]HET6244131.1 response regulator transcription factor [Bacteroidia bacterium]